MVSPNQNMRGGPVSRILSKGRTPLDDHSSEPRIAPWPLAANPNLWAKARPAAISVARSRPARGSYSALLPVGLAMRALLPAPRWALTPPFHPFPPLRTGGLFSVALSLGLPPPGVTRHRCLVESGLSSRWSDQQAAIQPSAQLRLRRFAGRGQRDSAPPDRPSWRGLCHPAGRCGTDGTAGESCPISGFRHLYPVQKERNRTPWHC